MKQTLFLLIAFFFTAIGASAQSENNSEKIISGMNEQGEKVYLVRYLESKVWHVDEIVQHDDGWQDLTSRRSYKNVQDAERAQVTLISKLVQTQPLNPLAQAESQDLVLQGGILWPTTQSWSWDWEKKYADWLTQTIDTEFFKKYNIATDCADVAYGARWIFARIHGLPVANRLSGSAALMTNQSLRPEWKNLPTSKNWHEDKRFRAALNYLMNMTYTHSLMRDSYPVAITPENFLPGIHHLDLGETSGHTQLVHRTDFSEQGLIPFLIVQSTVPRKVRSLDESLFWGDQLAKKNQSGFLRILWPKVKNGSYSLEKAENMPGYSLEQFSENFIREKDRTNGVEVMLRLKPTLNFVNILKSGYQNLKNMFLARLGVVEEGYRQCPNRSCPSNGATYDTWSTPSRDKHITDLIKQLRFLNFMNLPENVKHEMALVKDQAMESTAINLDNEDYTLKALHFAWDHQLYSSDPNDAPGIRWGISPEVFAQKIQNNLKMHLTERKSKISPLHDGILKQDFIISQNYCSAFSEQQCLRLKEQELSKTLEILGQTKSLQNWLDQALWLNSDPLQTSANQWGALRNQSKFQPLPEEVKTFAVSANGIGYMELRNGKKRIGVMGFNGLEDSPLPAGFHWSHFEQSTAIGWASAPGQILRHDFKTQTSTSFAIPSQEDHEILLVKGNHIVLKTPNHLWSLGLTAQSANLIWNDSVQNGTALNGNLVVGIKAEGWNLFDFSEPIPQIYSSDLDLSSATLIKENARWIGLNAKKRKIFIEKTSGKTFDVTHLGPTVLWTENLSKVALWKTDPLGFYITSLDSRFQEVTSQKIGDFGWSVDGYLMTMSFSQPQKIFKVAGNNFVELPLRPDEDRIVDFSGSWIATRLNNKNDTYRIRLADGSAAIYEGRLPALIAFQKNIDWIFVSDGTGESNVRLVNTKNPHGPALMTGSFFSNRTYGNFNIVRDTKISVERGLVTSFQGYQFWVEFP